MASKKISAMELNEIPTPYDRIPVITPDPLTWDGESRPINYVNRSINPSTLGNTQTLLLDMQANMTKNTNITQWDVATVLSSDDAYYLNDGKIVFSKVGLFEVIVTVDVDSENSYGQPTNWPSDPTELLIHLQNNDLSIVPLGTNSYRSALRYIPNNLTNPLNSMSLSSTFYFNVLTPTGAFSRLNTIIKCDTGVERFKIRAAVAVKKIGIAITPL